MSRQVITLTTDFGISDHFVGTMKGVILGICPNAAIVDITHHVTPYQIPEAAFLVEQAYPYFPKKTVHVVVVDPGVGTARRPILVEAAGQYFVAPDNGVLSLICSREKGHKVRHITAKEFFLDPVSATFHGRDIFAPVAAHLRKGTAPSKFGKLVQDHLRSNFDPVRTGKRFWAGTILKIDHFGNLITSFRTEEFPDLQERPFSLLAGLLPVERLVLTFADGEPDELVLIAGSSGYFEVACNQGSAAKKLGCVPGSPLELAVY
jgi:S-adenosyl-L-methionine hydrolase (adenosine-forming)